MKFKHVYLYFILMLLLSLKVFASGIEIDSITFYAENRELSKIRNGEIKSCTVLINEESNSQNVNVVTAVYSNDKVEQLDVKKVLLPRGESTIWGDEISISDSQNKEIRVYAFREKLGNIGTWQRLSKEAAASITSVTVKSGNETLESVIDDGKKEILLPFEYYVMGSNTSDLPDLDGVSIEIDAENFECITGEQPFSLKAPIYYKSTDRGPTVTYKLKADNKILQKFVDFEKTSVIDNCPDGTGDVGDPSTWSKSSTNCTVTVENRKLSGTDSSKALRLTKNAAGTAFLLTNTINDNFVDAPPIYYNEMVMEFDIRIDSMDSAYKEGDFRIAQGSAYTSEGSTLMPVFGRHSNVATGLADDEYGIALNNYGTPIKLTDFDGNEPHLKFKKWYKIKYVSRIDEYSGDYYDDIYIDGKFIQSVKNGNTKFGAPKGYIAGQGEDGKDIFNFQFGGWKNSLFDLSLDNMKITYSYGNDGKDLFLIGDSITASYRKTYYYDIQGWGKYMVEEHFDRSKLAVHNMAIGGHRAKLYVEGGSGLSRDYEADWQHIKGQAGEGDYVMISIGCNDISDADVEKYVKIMAEEAMDRGASVIIVTEPPEGGATIREREEGPVLYAVSEACGATFIDMGKLFRERLLTEVTDTYSEQQVSEYYYNGYDYGSSPDWTHLNTKGARLFAQILCSEIEKSESTLKDYLK